MGETFDFDKFTELSKNLNGNNLVKLGLPTNLSPAGAVTTLIKGAVPSIGKNLLGSIFKRLTGNLIPGDGFFRKLGRTIARVIDAILGVIVGVIGGAIVGAAGVGFAGLSGGLSGIALEPTTISVNNRDGDNFVIHGDKAHHDRLGGNYKKSAYDDYSGQQYHERNKADGIVQPTESQLNFME